MAAADFELKDAYIEGAKAGYNGMRPVSNPFDDVNSRRFWLLGYATVTAGWRPVPSFQRPLDSFWPTTIRSGQVPKMASRGMI